MKRRLVSEGKLKEGEQKKKTLLKRTWIQEVRIPLPITSTKTA